MVPVPAAHHQVIAQVSRRFEVCQQCNWDPGTDWKPLASVNTDLVPDAAGQGLPAVLCLQLLQSHWPHAAVCTALTTTACQLMFLRTAAAVCGRFPKHCLPAYLLGCLMAGQHSQT